MEVLTAAKLTPVSLHKATINSTERRAEPKRLLPLKFPRSSTSDGPAPSLSRFLSTSLSGSLAVLSSVNNELAKALTYEEALQQSVGSSSSFGGSSDFDISGLLNGIINFASENPLLIGGGAVVLAVPLVLSQVLKSPKPWGVESARNAYAKLSEDAGAQLLDIREGMDFKEVGSPDVRSLKKKAVTITFIRNDKPGFLKKLALKFKDPGNTTLFILDKFDGNSELVAELVTANGFKAAYAIKGGAEGARGWMNSGLPWLPPKKTLNLDFGDLKDAISGALGETSDSLPVTLGLVAATGLSLFAFTEMETVLQFVGSAALLQFVTKKFLFAEDRKVTLREVDEFLTTKVGPKELVDDLKMIGKALLPAAPSNAKASLPAPIEESVGTSTSSETKTEPKVEAAAEPPLAINSVPKAEISEASVPVAPRPLSPYPYYPDFKPPSSPCPSQP